MTTFGSYLSKMNAPDPSIESSEAFGLDSMKSCGMIHRSWNEAVRFRNSPNGSFSLNVTCFLSADAVTVSTNEKFALFGEIWL